MAGIKINGDTSGSTTITAPDTGTDETIELSTALASKLDLAGGKILQIVRSTFGSNASTNSTSFVDTGLSVSITPQNIDSSILLIATAFAESVNSSTNDLRSVFRITNASDVGISGATDNPVGSRDLVRTGTALIDHALTIIGYDQPSTTSITTYKLRFRSNNSACTTYIIGATTVAALYAIEVSA